jgi:hypothetical protein
MDMPISRQRKERLAYSTENVYELVDSDNVAKIEEARGA